MKYRLNPKIKIRKEYGDNFLVYVPQYRNLVFINSTGLEIINLLKGNLSEDEIIEELKKRYPSATDSVRKDVKNFLKYCEDNRIVNPYTQNSEDK